MPCDPVHRTPEMATCQCGHKIVVHEFDYKKRRKACSHMDEKGQCPCPSPR